MKFTIQEFYDMSDDAFRELYEGEQFHEILEFLEIRTRMELLSIIRGFKRKGDVLFEIRIKSSLSAYDKLHKELAKRQGEFGDEPVYLFDIIQDLVGARVICIEEEVQKQVFQDILSEESLAIQASGLEFYSAPFRDFTLARDIHDELVEIINGVTRTWEQPTPLEKKSKASNYESLHFYVKYESQLDKHLLDSLVKEREDQKGSEKVRNRAEAKYLIGLYESFSSQQLIAMRNFPVEFQIRTMLDHLWAQEEHKYIYKADTLAATGDENAAAKELLSGTFTGLKYAYYNVDRLRSLVRSVTSSKSTSVPAFAGRSKDNNPFRFIYFPDGGTELQTKFGHVERIFLEANRDFPGGVSGEYQVLEALDDLYKSVASFDANERKSGVVFDNANWGRKRIFYMFLAYLALSSSNKILSENTARFFSEKMGLLDFVGPSAFGGLINNREGTVKLASLIYDRVNKYDRLGWSNKDKNDDCSTVFLDPLVGIRLASSYFLQSEYAGATKAMRDMFAFIENDDRNWAENRLAHDLERAEVLMRYSQYVFFDNFKNSDGFQSSMPMLRIIFEDNFSLPNDAYSASIYRSYAWYYVLINYMIEQRIHIPETLMQYKKIARAYLLKYYQAAESLSTGGKPEMLLVSIYLPVHSDTDDDCDKIALIEGAFDAYSAAIQSHAFYPTSAINYLISMGLSMKERALRKVKGVAQSTFISYSHANKSKVEDIVALLEARKVNIFYDADFEGGRFVDQQIDKAMRNATSAIIVVTPEYWGSAYAAEERSYLMDMGRYEGLKLFILRLGVDDKSFRQNAPLMSGILSYVVSEGNLEEVISEIAQQVLNE